MCSVRHCHQSRTQQAGLRPLAASPPNLYLILSRTLLSLSLTTGRLGGGSFNPIRDGVRTSTRVAVRLQIGHRETPSYVGVATLRAAPTFRLSPTSVVLTVRDSLAYATDSIRRSDSCSVCRPAP
jgi:hypothetical protein